MKAPLNKNKLIGLTIKEAIKEIQRHENGATFNISVATEKTYIKDLKKVYKKIHEYNENGKRIYKVHTIRKTTYANHNEQENESFIIDVRFEQGEHCYMYWSGGASQTYKHNEYILIVDHLTKGNGLKPQYKTIKTDLIEYKDGELTQKQRRFTL